MSKPTVESLLADLREMFEAHESYGTGFYNTPAWFDAYARLRAAAGFEWSDALDRYILPPEKEST